MPVEKVSAASVAAGETARAAHADRIAAQNADAKRAEPRPEPVQNRAPDITGAIVDTQG